MISFSDEVFYLGMLGDHGKLAAVDRNGSVSWGELASRVVAATDFLRDKQLPPRSRVLFIARDSIEHQVMLFACANLGLIIVPLSVHYTHAEVADIIEVARPSIGFAESEFAAKLEGLQGCEAVVGDSAYLEFTFAGDVPDLRGVKVSRTPLAITFTSGSTARPKPVLFSAEGELATARLHANLWQLNANDRVLQATAGSWILGLSTIFVPTLASGGTVLYPERYHPALLCDFIEEHGATVFSGVTTQFRMLVNYCEQNGRRPQSSSRMVFSSAEKRDEKVFKRFEGIFGVSVFDLYASSEVRPGFGYDPAIDDRPRPGSCGRLISGIDLKLTPFEGEEAPDARFVRQGDLSLRSPGNFMGYFTPEKLVDPEVGPETFIPMGERFALDKDGYGYVLDRSKNVINRGGAKISPLEVETCLRTHDRVSECAVVGLPDEKYGEKVAAIVVGRFDSSAEADTVLSEFLSSSLAVFKVPQLWLVVNEIPLNSNGKTDRNKIKNLFPVEEKVAS